MVLRRWQVFRSKCRPRRNRRTKRKKAGEETDCRAVQTKFCPDSKAILEPKPIKGPFIFQEWICIATFIPDLSHWPGVTEGKCVPIMNVEVNTQQQQWTPSVSSFPCSKISEWCILIPPLGRDRLLDVMWTGVLQNASLVNLPSDIALVATSPVANMRCV